MSSPDDSLTDGLGSPSHASSPVGSEEDFCATRESGLGEEGGTGSWLPGQGGGSEEEDEQEEEEIMEEFRCVCVRERKRESVRVCVIERESVCV